MRTTSFLIIMITSFVCKPQGTTVQFAQINKSIVIEATVGNKTGYFILDTGTPNLVLNNKIFKGRGRTKQILGISGKVLRLGTSFIELTIRNLKWHHIEADLINLEHLSRVKELPIMGLIGNSLLRQFEMTIDFHTSTLQLQKVSRKGVEPLMSELPAASFPFIWKAGIPVIKMSVGKHQFLMGFDTGATINILNKHLASKLKEYIDYEDDIKVSGLAKGRQRLAAGLIREVMVGDYLCPTMRMAFASFAHLHISNSGFSTPDGFLGHEFLQHFKTKINFLKRTIHVYYREGRSDSFLMVRKDK